LSEENGLMSRPRKAQAFLVAFGIAVVLALTPLTALANEPECPASFEIHLATDGSATINIDGRLRQPGPPTPLTYYIQLLDPAGTEEYRTPQRTATIREWLKSGAAYAPLAARGEYSARVICVVDGTDIVLAEARAWNERATPRRVPNAAPLNAQPATPMALPANNSGRSVDSPPGVVATSPPARTPPVVAPSVPAIAAVMVGDCELCEQTPPGKVALRVLVLRAGEPLLDPAAAEAAAPDFYYAFCEPAQLLAASGASTSCDHVELGAHFERSASPSAEITGQDLWQIVFLLPDGDQDQEFSVQWGDAPPIKVWEAQPVGANQPAATSSLAVTDTILSNRRPHGCAPVNPPFCYSLPPDTVELTVVFKDGGGVDRDWAKAKAACQTGAGQTREECEFAAYLKAMEQFDTTFCWQRNPSGRNSPLSAVVVGNGPPINCASSDWDERDERWILSFSLDKKDEDKALTLLLTTERRALPKPRTQMVSGPRSIARRMSAGSAGGIHSVHQVAPASAAERM
jgi:hypothetical protein